MSNAPRVHNAVQWLRVGETFLFDRWRELNRLERQGYKALVQMGVAAEAGVLHPFARDAMERVNALEAASREENPEIRVEAVWPTPVEQQLVAYKANPPASMATRIRQKAFQAAHEAGLAKYVEIKLGEDGGLVPMHTLESVTPNTLAGFTSVADVESKLVATEFTLEEARANVAKSLALRVIGYTTMDVMLEIVSRHKVRGVYNEKEILAMSSLLWKDDGETLQLDMQVLAKMEQKVVVGAALMRKSQHARLWQDGTAKLLIVNLAQLASDLDLPDGLDQMVKYVEELQQDYPNLATYYLTNTRRMAELWAEAWASARRNDMLALRNQAKDKA